MIFHQHKDSIVLFTGANPQESTTDRILTSCEVLKAAVSTMLDAFNQATETRANKGRFIKPLK